MGLIYKRLPVKGNKGSKTLRVLMDTGASHTVIRADIARQLATSAPLAKAVRADFAYGRGKINEMVSLLLRINGQEVVTPAFVLKGLSEQLIIGAEFFQRYKVVLDPEKEKIRFTDPEALKVKII